MYVIFVFIIVFLGVALHNGTELFLIALVLILIFGAIAYFFAVRYEEATASQVKFNLFYQELERTNPIEWQEIDMRLRNDSRFARSTRTIRERKESLEEMKKKYPHLWESAERKFTTLSWWDRHFIPGDD